MERSIIDCRHYDAFETFYNEVLSPWGKLYPQISDMIYRGQASGEWTLLPSALRSVKDETYKYCLHQFLGIKHTPQHENIDAQISLEKAALREFYQKSNINGLPLPHIEEFSNYDYSSFTNDVIPLYKRMKWLNHNYAEVGALAQHYGVPTRMLDWSADIHAALYFAARDGLQKLKNNEISKDHKIALWALDNKHFKLRNSTVCPLKFIFPRYADNPNLKAQKGILSYWEFSICPTHLRNDSCGRLSWEERKELHIDIHDALLFSSRIDRSPLEALLQDIADIYCPDEDITFLYKLELPVTETEKLFQYLKTQQYTAARLFPGYGGVTQEIKEEKLLLA